LGIAVGNAIVIGDRSWFGSPSYNGGFVGELSLRKALGYVLSLRGSASYSTQSIPGSQNGVTPYTKNNSLGFSMDALASLNNIAFHRGNPKINVYALGGYSLMISTIERVNDNWNDLQKSAFANNPKVSGSKLKNAWWHGLDVGAGVAFKLSDRVNLAIEDKLIIPVFGNDYLDGFKAGNFEDIMNHATLRLNINLGNNARRVQPLWWINPLNYAYNELNEPKHMKYPKVEMVDSDGDGVADQFDLEPNTPSGASVDSHGRAIDTDGDGVPDYKDKEKLTSQSCFPVNSDGVGTCPEPACCKELRDQIANLPKQTVVDHSCSLTGLPSIQFKAGSAQLSKAATNQLDATAAAIKANPDCNVKVIGHPAASKRSQQLAFDRVDAVIKYLVSKQGISEDRFIFSYDGGYGDSNTIDLLGTTENGPNRVNPPAPQYKTKN
jgi:outer membrane protein OmpA-like peptidoglycan-associated protein